MSTGNHKNCELILGSEIHCGLFLCVVFVFTWLFGTSTVPGGPPSTQGDSNSFLLMAMCWIAVALVLYLLRPASLRNRGDSKRRDTGFVCKFHALLETEFFTCGTCVWMLKSWWAYSHALSETVMYNITIQWTEAVQEFLRTNEEVGSDVFIKYYIDGLSLSLESLSVLMKCYRDHIHFILCVIVPSRYCPPQVPPVLSSDTSVSKMCCLSEVDSECCWYCHSFWKLFKLSKVWSPPPTHTHTRDFSFLHKYWDELWVHSVLCSLGIWNKVARAWSWLPISI
jgi:hypothetical protein